MLVKYNSNMIDLLEKALKTLKEYEKYKEEYKMKDIVDLFCILFIIFIIILYFKNQITYKNMCIIGNAIWLYNSKMIESGNYDKILDYDTVIPVSVYNRTLYRLFDWGYYNILSADIFALIKPYIPEAIEKYYSDNRKFSRLR